MERRDGGIEKKRERNRRDRGIKKEGKEPTREKEGVQAARENNKKGIGRNWFI